MPYAMLPRGYRAVFLGSATSIDALSTFAPLEEGQAEGSLMVMRLDFAGYPSLKVLSQLNAASLEEGVPPWPGCGYIVFAAQLQPTVYIAWQKGIAWIPIIIGLVATLLLPPLLMAGIWLILPEAVKGMINAIFMLGIMVLGMFVMVKIMSALIPAKEKPKEIEEKAK